MPAKKGSKNAKGNSGGKKGKSGRKTTTQEFVMTTAIDKFSPIFWKELEKMIKSKIKADKKFAMSEFNKIQIKRIPTKLTGEDGGPIEITWLK